MNDKVWIITLVLAGIAMVFDVKTDKVPNKLIVSGYAIAFIAALPDQQAPWQCLLAALWPIVLCYPLFLLRGLGAGDIKLFSVISVMHPGTVMLQIMVSSVFFAGFSLVPAMLLGRIQRDGEGRHYVHYTIGIFLACVWVWLREAAG